MNIDRIRYMTNVRLLDGATLPSSPWVLYGPGYGTVSSSGRYLTIDHTTVGAVGLRYGRPEHPVLNASKGVFVELRARLDSYTTHDGPNPERGVSGAGFSIDDGTYQLMMLFADAGPPLGKIVMFAVDPDLEQNLLDIRASTPHTVNTFAKVDWTQFHMYRVEKTVGGNLELFIDDDVVPALRIESSRFTGIPTALSTGAVFFGSVVRDRLTTSTWEFFRYGISTGFEVSGYPVISESEMLTRFNNYINVIAEAGT
jgi:hypothetical protein